MHLSQKRFWSSHSVRVCYATTRMQPAIFQLRYHFNQLIEITSQNCYTLGHVAHLCYSKRTVCVFFFSTCYVSRYITTGKYQQMSWEVTEASPSLKLNTFGSRYLFALQLHSTVCLNNLLSITIKFVIKAQKHSLKSVQIANLHLNQ
jgi:hypothetical protein